jgi:hypothetical protein
LDKGFLHRENENGCSIKTLEPVYVINSTRNPGRSSFYGRRVRRKGGRRTSLEVSTRE